jgi:predicted RNA binding protein YcfA (HicA-like mRNA interferase family)
MTRRLRRLWERAQNKPAGWSAAEVDELARLLGFVEQKKRGKGDHRLYLHPKGLVWGFDPRGNVKPPYVKELVRLAQTNSFVESDETESEDDKS